MRGDLELPILPDPAEGIIQARFSLSLSLSLLVGVRMSGFRRDLEDPNRVTGHVFYVTRRGIVKLIVCSTN